MGRDYIRFQRQPRPYGCMYYSLAALVDVPDGWAEEHEEDCSVERFVIRAREHGVELVPLYFNDEPCPRRLWESLVRRFGNVPGSFHDFHLAIHSPTYEGVTHSVGLRLYFDDFDEGGVFAAVVVDTSGHDAVQSFGWEHFLASPYAEALDVRLVWTTDLDGYAPVPGPEMPHVAQAEATADA